MPTRDGYPLHQTMCPATRNPACRHVDAAPAVEGDADGIGLEHSMDLIKGAQNPKLIAIVRYGAAESIAIIDEVRGIREDEIKTVGRKALEYVAAVTLIYAVVGEH